MNLTLKSILEEVKSDSKLTVINGKLKVWHYSNVRITDGVISTKGKQGLQSKGEYETWGRDRVFFYATEDGYKYDKGISTEYKYVSYIPLNKIYDINKNPNEYSGNWEDMYKQSKKDGYTAWLYDLGGKKGAPIVISFEDVPISKAYEPARGGGYKVMGEENVDYVIGTINYDNEDWLIYQKSEYPKSLTNTYLSQETDPQEAMESYQGEFPQFMWKEAQIDPKYVSDYKKEIKASR